MLTIQRFQPCTNFTEIITHLKESLKQNYYRSKFENCSNVKKPGKLLMKLFLQKQKKAK